MLAIETCLAKYRKTNILFMLKYIPVPLHENNSHQTTVSLITFRKPFSLAVSINWLIDSIEA